MNILDNGGLVDAGGLRVGHAHLPGTGVSVAVFDTCISAGVDVRGSAPGTRETDLLAPTAAVQGVNAIVLSGGSAFGLASATGVMEGLAERGQGLDTGMGIVPIVPAAVIFDLPVSGGAFPTSELGRQALDSARTDNRERGNVGAGTGATIGKYLGVSGVMRGGLGQAAVTDGELVVSAMVVVNALGDIYEGETKIAGARQGNQLAPTDMCTSSNASLTNTTIGIVATNAELSKPAANKVAAVSHDGLARAISPVHSMDDGDALFAVSTGTHQANLNAVCYLAAEAVRLAVLDGIRRARTYGPIPALADLATLSDH